MSDETRDRLLEVAREILSSRGYVGLTMKTAAGAAGITPEVARRYFKNRDALFAAALKLPVDPSSAVPALLAPGLEGVGERVVRLTFDLLSDESARSELMSLARAGSAAGHASIGLQEFLEHSIVDRLASAIGVPDARMRSALAASYLLGVAMSRYALRVEPLASASEEEVVRLVAPVIQDLLDPRKPLPGSGSGSGSDGGRDRSQPAPATTPADSATAPMEPDPAPTAAPVPAPPSRPVRKFDPDPAATAAALQEHPKHAQD